jgi:hypothetical protein
VKLGTAIKDDWPTWNAIGRRGAKIGCGTRPAGRTLMQKAKQDQWQWPHHHVEMEERTWWSQLYYFTDRDCFKLVCDLKSEELIITCFSVLVWEIPPSRVPKKCRMKKANLFAH